MWTIWDDITEEGKRWWKGETLSLDKNCDSEVQLRICAGRLFHAVSADIENELSTQRRRERGKMRLTYPVWKLFSNSS